MRGTGNREWGTGNGGKKTTVARGLVPRVVGNQIMIKEGGGINLFVSPVPFPVPIFQIIG